MSKFTCIKVVFNWERGDYSKGDDYLTTCGIFGTGINRDLKNFALIFLKTNYKNGKSLVFECTIVAVTMSSWSLFYTSFRSQEIDCSYF